jgi:hypothetical protein
MFISGKIPKLHLSAINYYADILFTPTKKLQLEITVQYKKLDVYGSMYIVDYNLKGKPSSFMIEVDRSLNKEEKLKTLAHEMVHIKQYSLGYLNESMTRWRGEKILNNNIKYEDRPWEIEAEFYGLNLYESFMVYH